MFPQASQQHTDYQMPRTSPNYHLQQHQALLQQQLQVFHHFQAFQRHQFPSSPSAAAAAAAAAAALATQQHQLPSTDQQTHHNQPQPPQQQLWPTHPAPCLAHNSSDSEPSLSGASAPHSPIDNSLPITQTSTTSSSAEDDSAGHPADRQIPHYSSQTSPRHENNSAQHMPLIQVPSSNRRQHHKTSVSQTHLDKPHRPPSTKPKRVRTIFTPEQLKRLEYEFNNQMYLVGHDRCCLADSLNLSEAQVKVWFQNRRIKHRKLNPFV